MEHAFERTHRKIDMIEAFREFIPAVYHDSIRCLAAANDFVKGPLHKRPILQSELVSTLRTFKHAKVSRLEHIVAGGIGPRYFH